MMPDGTYHTFMRDYTERKANEEKMLSLIKDLEAFSSTVSHDLRTPLSNIILSAEILKTQHGQFLDEQGLRLLRTIESTAGDMSVLVENLLLIAHSEQIQQPTEPTDTNEVLRKVVAGFASRLEAVDVNVKTASLPSIKVPETFIHQVFQNLICNALNYASSPQSTIEVGSEQQGDRLRLFVRDHGPGLSPTERRRVFDVFYRADNSKASGGFGLGLAIVARIARSLGGRAWVEETPGGGCTFCLEMVNVTE